MRSSFLPKCQPKITKTRSFWGRYFPIHTNFTSISNNTFPPNFIKCHRVIFACFSLDFFSFLFSHNFLCKLKVAIKFDSITHVHTNLGSQQIVKSLTLNHFVVCFLTKEVKATKNHEKLSIQTIINQVDKLKANFVM